MPISAMRLRTLFFAADSAATAAATAAHAADSAATTAAYAADSAAKKKIWTLAVDMLIAMIEAK